MAQWKEMMHAPVRDLRIGGRIVFGSGQECALNGDRVLSFSIDEGTSGCLEPGCVLSAACTLDLVNDAGQWDAGGSLIGHDELIGATILPELGALDGTDIAWQPMGAFEVVSALKLEGEGILRLQAQDSIASELSAEFQDGLAYPCTLQAMWEHAIHQSRYVFSGSIPNGSAVVSMAPDWKHASLRTAMGCIAAAAGCFVRIGRSGGLELCPLWRADAPVYEIDGESYLKLECDRLRYGPVDSLKLKCAGSDEEMVYRFNGEAAMHALSVSENPLFQAEMQDIGNLALGMLAVVAGFETESLRFDWRGDPCLQVGDRIEVCDLSGDLHHAVLSRQTLRFDGSLSAACVCDVPADNNSGIRRALTPEGGLNAAALTGAVDGALLSVGSVTANKLAAGSVTAEKIAAGVLDAVSIDAATAKIESLTSADIETDRLAAALAAFTVVTAGTAKFDHVTVSHLVSQALNLEFGVADQVFIKNLAVAYGQMVSATIGSLCIRASDGNYYTLDVSEDGMVTSIPFHVTESELAVGQTESGRMILETNITSENLNTGNLLATYALVNRIDAARIDVDELFAREAFIAMLRTCRIMGDKTLEIIVQDAGNSVSKDEFQRVLRVDDRGLHVGDNQTGGEVLVDSGSVNVILNGRQYSSFAANYVQFGNYQLRKTADGGLAFKLKEV